ncbi:FecCD family ABC transporter permease [Agromyces sp. NPDC057679]|uniref:FecCD family ABC transporter permease n=1 Tax=Agromyces sp. NPDC057679 TaxID=3346207 RepID=UPI0036730969
MRPTPVDPAVVAAVAGVRARNRRRLGVVLGAGFALILVIAVIALSSGAASLSPDRVIATLLGQGERTEQLVVFTLRLPRILAAVLVGAAFGLAGAVFQSVLRNPLASPDILGVSTGASLGAVWAILGLGITGAAVAGFALAGGLAVAAIIWASAWRQGLHGIRFVLVGVGLAYVCASLIAWLLARADVRQAQTALLWTVGSVSDVRGDELWLLAAGLALGCLLVALSARGIAVLGLGDERAASLGMRANANRGLLLLAAVLLIALGTSVAGPIAFVALIAPAIARRLVDDGSAALTASAVSGAALTLGADVLGQFAMPGLTAPVGIVTGLIGAPYLLWLLSRSERKSRP